MRGKGLSADRRLLSFWFLPGFGRIGPYASTGFLRISLLDRVSVGCVMSNPCCTIDQCNLSQIGPIRKQTDEFVYIHFPAREAITILSNNSCSPCAASPFIPTMRASRTILPSAENSAVFSTVGWFMVNGCDARPSSSAGGSNNPSRNKNSPRSKYPPGSFPSRGDMPISRVSDQKY